MFLLIGDEITNIIPSKMIEDESFNITNSDKIESYNFESNATAESYNVTNDYYNDPDRNLDAVISSFNEPVKSPDSMWHTDFENAANNLIPSINQTNYLTLDDLCDPARIQGAFSILQLNCRSLKQNFQSFNHLIHNFKIKPSIISLAETWLNTSDNILSYSLQDYSFFIPTQN